MTERKAVVSRFIVYCVCFHLKEQCVRLRGIFWDFPYDLCETEGEVHYVILHYMEIEGLH